MPRFDYQARTQAGDLVNGTLDAPDRRAALTRIDALGYFPVRVGAARQRDQAKGRRPAQRRRRRGRVRQRDILVFTQQLANLLRSGMSLSRSLEALRRQAEDRPLGPVIGDIHDEIRQGTNLSDALAKYPRMFPNLYSSMVRAGEASGTLPIILDRLAKYYERSQELREKIVGAMIYPALIMVVGIGLIVFVMVFMVPRFEMLFRELQATLPLPTQILISISRGLLRYGWLGIVAAAGILEGMRRLGGTPKGRLWIDTAKLRLPLVGGIIAKGMFTHFARTLGTLLANGVPVLESLRIVERTLGNAALQGDLREARGRVTDGTTIAQPLAAGKRFPRLLIDMLSVGEETGNLPASLDHIADMYEQELERDVKVFTTLLEPVMILVMAGVVGGVVFSILIAVFQMTSGLEQM